MFPPRDRLISRQSADCQEFSPIETSRVAAVQRVPPDWREICGVGRVQSTFDPRCVQRRHASATVEIQPRWAPGVWHGVPSLWRHPTPTAPGSGLHLGSMLICALRSKSWHFLLRIWRCLPRPKRSKGSPLCKAGWRMMDLPSKAKTMVDQADRRLASEGCY